MSLAVVSSRAITGMTARPVRVEVHLANGLPGLSLVGLPDTEVKESRERVRSALQNSRFEFPARRITINLAPADLPKASGCFDLPIALGILAASGQLPEAGLRTHEFAGELSLTGELRPIRGGLAMASAIAGSVMGSTTGSKTGSTTPPSSSRALVLPASSAQEAALVEDATVYGARTLLDVCAHLAEPDVATPLPRAMAPKGLTSDTALSPASVSHASDISDAIDVTDMLDIKGQEHAKRALEVAAAGGHHLLLYGPPGTGKSMLAMRLAGILPSLSKAQAVEAATLASLSTQGFDMQHWGRRPFRAPHHTASAAALVGGGSTPRPGEISLAHRGVLFLDELEVR